MIDHFDRVRGLYAAVNAGDEVSIVALYAGDAVVERLFFTDDAPDRVIGQP